MYITIALSIRKANMTAQLDVLYDTKVANNIPIYVIKTVRLAHDILCH